MGFNDFFKNGSSEISTATTADIHKELEKREGHPNIFPLEIFNPKVKPFIQELHSKYDIPRSYIGLAMLVAYSTAIGTAYAVSRNGSDRMYLSLWGCMNGISSSGKSYALDMCFAPLNDLQNEFDADWDEQTGSLTDEQRQRKEMKVLIYRDAYIPTLIRYIMPVNPKGVLKESDEILEWINGLNALAKKESTDEQFWLSAWDGRKYSAIRSSNSKYVIPRVFTNIIGGIQPKLLYKLFKNERDQSGFIFRVLFATPEVFKIARPIHGYDIPYEFKQVHNRHVRSLYNSLPVENGYDEPKVCLMTREATEMMIEWEDKRINSINAIADVNEMSIHSGILGKMKAYAYRFAGILAVSDKAFERLGEPYFPDQLHITSDIMARALKAADYFYKAAVDVYDAQNETVTAPLEVLQLAAYVKMGKTLNQIADLMNIDKGGKMNASARKQAMKRKLDKAIKDYPKVFAAQTN